MKNTKIEWADHTVNFWWGCSFARYLHSDDVREECLHCYALTLAKLFSKGKATWGPDGNRWIRHEAARRELYALDEALHGTGRRERVFINSMSDTFEDRADLDEARSFLWDACQWVQNLDLLLLTKRPGKVAEMVPVTWLAGEWPRHVWIGTTAGTQRAADENIPLLLSIPAKVRFLSCEPLLGPVDLTRIDATSETDPGFNALELRDDDEGDLTETIKWVICGGKSGAKARPMNPDWARSLRNQCADTGVPFFFKQWGEWVRDASIVTTHPPAGIGPDHSRAVPFGDGDPTNFRRMYRVGKVAAGRLLDGREHNEVPQ